MFDGSNALPWPSPWIFTTIDGAAVVATGGAVVVGAGRVVGGAVVGAAVVGAAAGAAVVGAASGATVVVVAPRAPSPSWLSKFLSLSLPALLSSPHAATPTERRTRRTRVKRGR